MLLSTPKILPHFNYFVNVNGNIASFIAYLDLIKIDNRIPRSLGYMIQTPGNTNIRFGGCYTGFDETTYKNFYLSKHFDFNKFFNPHASTESETKRGIYPSIKHDMLYGPINNNIIKGIINLDERSRDRIIIKFWQDYYEGIYLEELMVSDVGYKRRTKADFNQFIENSVYFSEQRTKLAEFFAQNYKILCDELLIKE